MEEVIVEPVEEIVVPIVVELPDLEYRYQPKDESGRKLGGEQVIKYKTAEELTQKLVAQNEQLVRKLREQTRKQRLGISDTENIPDDAAKFEVPLEFNPRQLTPDERVQLSRDLLDPERCEEATNTMFEAAVGVKPSLLSATLSRLSQNEMRLLARVESDAFMAANPRYYKCQENYDAITGWLVKNNLAPLQQNFQLAYDTLQKDNVILFESVPVVPMVKPLVEPIEEPIVPTREEILEPVLPVASVAPKPIVAPPATGLTRIPAGDVGDIVKPKKYTLKQINEMDGETYKQKLLHEKGFSQLVQELENEAAANRGRR